MNTDRLKVNIFLFLKLPAAFWCGVRLKSINNQICITSVKHRWMNQNPFNSMYFAVQSMAAELSTGALILKEIKNSKKNISMLVANSNASFLKKATGRIFFECHQGTQIQQAIQQAIRTHEGQTIWLKSIGKNTKNEQVSVFNFEWTIKIKP